MCVKNQYLTESSSCDLNARAEGTLWVKCGWMRWREFSTGDLILDAMYQKQKARGGPKNGAFNRNEVTPTKSEADVCRAGNEWVISRRTGEMDARGLSAV